MPANVNPNLDAGHVTPDEIGIKRGDTDITNIKRASDADSASTSYGSQKIKRGLTPSEG
jgi:hypothetical protein